MVEVQADRVFADRDDDRIHQLAILIPHGQFDAGFHRDVGGDFAARDRDDGFRIALAITILGSHLYLACVADFHPIQFFFQPGDDVLVTLDEQDRVDALGGVDDLAVDPQGVIQADDHVVGHNIWFLRCVHRFHLF